jgi:type 1 glutamine amidotransferase
VNLRALLVTGQSSQHHDWPVTSAAIAQRLEETGRFTVETVTHPYPGPEGPGLHGKDGPVLHGAFDRYDVVLLDYEGDRWPAEVEDALERYVRDGGGLVIVHAADNAFPGWPAFQTLCGVTGWGGRDESAGPKVRWRDGAQVLDHSAGTAMHPPRQQFRVVTRAPDHPVMRGLPAAWMHADDELYSQLRGPAAGLEVLATARIDATVHPKATGEEEPVLMTIRYGEGRVFHTTLGHVGPADGSRTTAIDCVGFIITLQRGTEWAATGDVTIPVPDDFPTPDRTSLRQ